MRFLKSIFLPVALYLVAATALLWGLSVAGVQGDLLASGMTALVGLSAYVVYKLNEYNGLRDSAKILILEIRHAEQVIAALKAQPGPAPLATLEKAVNNWPQKRQHFVGELNSDEFSQFEVFFLNWGILIKSKRDIDLFTAELLAYKGQYSQRLLLDFYALSEDEYAKKREAVIARANNEKWLFAPDGLNLPIQQCVETSKPLTGTSGFEKIRRLAELH